METNFEAYSQYIKAASELAAQYGIKLLFAIAIFVIGKRLARGITNLAIKGMEKQDIDVELIGFFDSLIYLALFAMVIIAALGQLGIQTASFVAIIGAAGLAVGLALQGSLSNFAAGVLIILLRPIRVGDFADIAGTSGTVRNIRIFTTELRTGDNKAVIIPNSRVLDSNITNYSSTGTRRIDMVFGIGYDDDIDQAKKVLLQIVEKDERVLQNPAPVVAVNELADSSVNFIVRPWVKTADYWGVHNDTMEAVKKGFDAKGISIPYPQSQVHMISANAESQ
ncbi:MAG: mechanosensitive ion channel [Gammaproteobacteria bacterium]|nr:mechanosensitive ion channel [Gammaproteobacteria bacterium]